MGLVCFKSTLFLKQILHGFADGSMEEGVFIDAVQERGELKRGREEVLA